MKPIDYVENALKGLKDFQMASVEALYAGLYEKGQNRMLLADEVGLGKTVVARGLIAKILKDRLKRGARNPLKVTYICSNQVLAKENIRKLNFLPNDLAWETKESRIAYLAFDFSEHDNTSRGPLLLLNSLTPSTSFQTTSGIGDKWERKRIFAALCSDPAFRGEITGLCWLLNGDCEARAYRKVLKQGLECPLRPEVPDRFLRLLHQDKVSVNQIEGGDELLAGKEVSLYDATLGFAKHLRYDNHARYSAGIRFLVRKLREHLIESCIKFLDADLYILDEFQRFSDLVNYNKEGERGEIAKKVFERRKSTRILLLSATPFKAFTHYGDVERGQDHFEELQTLLGSLLKGDEERLSRYQIHRKALYQQICDLQNGLVTNLDPQHREAVEEILRTVICRTERANVIANPNALIRDVWDEADAQIPFGAGDIHNFRLADQLAAALTKVGYPAGKPVEYCKSALFPFSFLDRYKLKEVLKEYRDHPDVSAVLGSSKQAWLDLDAIDSYQWSAQQEANRRGGAANARLLSLIDSAVGDRGAELLWIPPCLPYYPLEGGFRETDGFTKTLLFSSWIMVPRMVSTLVSYEVELRTVGNKATVRSDQEKESRTYFNPKPKKRHPVPQLLFKKQAQGEASKLGSMSNFALMYPSLSLCHCIDPLEAVQSETSLEELLNLVALRIRQEIEDKNLRQFEGQSSESDRWYWAAPFLLDKLDDRYRQTVSDWLDCESIASGVEHEDSEDPGAKEERFNWLWECFNDPLLAELGPMPNDLSSVLARMALGSPGILAIRSLTRLFPEAGIADHLTGAFHIADQFRLLFNKPESIAAVRLSTEHDWYWSRVIDYCSYGCLQAVLDEYLHLLKEQHGDMAAAIGQLSSSINLNSAGPNVDSLESFLNDDPKRMRTHYAVEFGSQRIETDEGEKRASNLREGFNSPFRPFVLATTSIGQEGLDFHQYCRRVVHWNLPGNPIDLEQREGRVNRYKSHVIRQQVARKYRSVAVRQRSAASDIWTALFVAADESERDAKDKCELVPFWHVEADDDLQIERVVPLYPFSNDGQRLSHILKTLAIYRLAFGQPRQAELVDRLLERKLSQKEIQHIMDTLMINLSPIRYGKETVALPGPETLPNEGERE